MLVPIVSNLADNHWHQLLKESLYALKEILQKIDHQAYNNSLHNLDNKKYDKNIRITQTEDERNKMDQKWENLMKIALKNNPYFNE